VSAGEATRYRLDAADGVPADFRIPFEATRSGVWRVRAEWSGRGIAGLWLHGADGQVVSKRVAVSPLELAFEVADHADAARPPQLSVRFATTTDGGRLDGLLEVIAPGPGPGVPAAEPDESPPPERLEGPGQCLAPHFTEPVHGRVLEHLARSLEGADDAEAAWCIGWVRRVMQAFDDRSDNRGRRDALDFLWGTLLEDEGHAGETGHAMRRLLSTTDELLRREGLSKRPERERQRQDALLGALECLGTGGAS
jgi:hypothetical protein